MKALFIIVPILLVGGVLGAGYMGYIKIPGVTPKSAQGKADDMYGEGADELYGEQIDDLEPLPIEDEEPADEVTVTVEPQQPDIDHDLGARQLAKIWNEIKTGDLVKIAEGYSDTELGRVMFFMQKSKVAEVLAKVDPDRAAKLSKEIQRLASIVPAAEQ